MRCIIVMFIACTLVACAGKYEPGEQQAAAADTTRYFDLPGAIRTELDEIRRVPRVMYQLRTMGGEKDSVRIDTTALQQLAAPFLQLDLNNPSLKPKYRETVFEDNDTRSFVLNYVTTDPALPARNISVMLDNETQELKRIDMMRFYQQKDTSFEERLAWSAGKGFQLVQMATVGKTELTRQTNAYWGLSQ